MPTGSAMNSQVRLIGKERECKRMRELLLQAVPGLSMSDPKMGRKTGRDGEPQWLCYGVVEAWDSDPDEGGGS